MLPEDLTEDQKNRLRALREEILIDKITVSFSIDGRDYEGRRKSAFYSVTSSRSSAEGSGPSGWTLAEIRSVRALLSAHVVAATYDDAFRRQVLPVTTELKAERAGILEAYEKLLTSTL